MAQNRLVLSCERQTFLLELHVPTPGENWERLDHNKYRELLFKTKMLINDCLGKA